jgi:hypothetical protein
MNDSRLTRCLFQPTLFVGLGGMGNELLLVVRAYVYMALGFMPECFRWLGVDFASDPPQTPVAVFAREVSADVWRHAELRPAEQCLISLCDDSAELAARVKAGDADVAWIGEMLTPEVIAAYKGTEASAVPAIGRAALARCAHDPDLAGGVSWVEEIEGALASLGPGGVSSRAFQLNREVPPGSWKPGPIRVVLLAGAQGGTGGGTLLPLATVVRWAGRHISPRVQIDAQVIAGDYRPRDAQEKRKAQLNRAFDMDIEYAAGSHHGIFTLPLGPGRRAEARGPILDTVYRLEAWGALRHNTPAVLAHAGQALTRRYLARAAQERRRSQANVRILPALVKSGAH